MVRANEASRTIPVNNFGNAQAIRYRLQKAFPEVAKFFPALSRNLRSGNPLATALSAVVYDLPAGRLERVSLEVNDLFSMGWTDAAQFDLVMGSIFGLDIAMACQISGSTAPFLATVSEMLVERRQLAATGRR